MNKLFKGVSKFTNRIYRRYKSLFMSLKDEQHPHTLFITCSDSRIDPNLITSTLPGELFVVRNVANIVPPFVLAPQYVSAPSAIEYAVKALKVANIVVCGHSDCGGCKALTVPYEELDDLPFTRQWIELARPAEQKVVMEQENHDHHDHSHNLYTEIEKQNVLLQVQHLFSYPFIKERVLKGDLKVYGWYYDIGNGHIYNYDMGDDGFKLVR